MVEVERFEPAMKGRALVGLAGGPTGFLPGAHPKVSSSCLVPEAALAGLGFCFPRTTGALGTRVTAALGRVSAALECSENKVTGAGANPSFRGSLLGSLGHGLLTSELSFWPGGGPGCPAQLSWADLHHAPQGVFLQVGAGAGVDGGVCVCVCVSGERGCPEGPTPTIRLEGPHYYPVSSTRQAGQRGRGSGGH